MKSQNLSALFYVLMSALAIWMPPVNAEVIKAGGPPLPSHGWLPTPWGDPPNGDHNHNHNQAVNIENVLNPSNRMYDGYGSWFDDGSGMKFHWTNSPAGNNDPDFFGHGYIRPDKPINYQYGPTFNDYAPTGAFGIINSAFDLWESEINGTQGFRNPLTKIGFAWDFAQPGDAAQIVIDWLPQSPGEAFVDLDDDGRWDIGESFTDSDSDSLYDSDTAAPAWVTPAAFPTLNFVDGWFTDGVWNATNFYLGGEELAGVEYDLLSTSIHELGHLLGLDDLYNLYDGAADPFNAFPGSVMGTNWTGGKDSTGTGEGVWDPYKRNIDLGSIQGGIDLYSIPIPEPQSLALLLLGMGLMMLSRSNRTDMHCR